jgi:hypothetical protein
MRPPRLGRAAYGPALKVLTEFRADARAGYIWSASSTRQRTTTMSSIFSALFLFVFGLRPVRAYRPELHYMRGPGPKCREKIGAGLALGR